MNQFPLTSSAALSFRAPIYRGLPAIRRLLVAPEGCARLRLRSRRLESGPNQTLVYVADASPETPVDRHAVALLLSRAMQRWANRVTVASVVGID